MDDAAAWERLCSLLDDDDQLCPGVRAALEDGDADPWMALLDGLDDAGALAYLDAEDTGMELADALAHLPRVFRVQPDLGGVNDTDDLGAALRGADHTLRDAGFRLVLLEEDEDDALALVVVPSGSLQEISDLASGLGRTLTSFA